jgi:hypothetical protein
MLWISGGGMVIASVMPRAACVMASGMMLR